MSLSSWRILGFTRWVMGVLWVRCMRVCVSRSFSFLRTSLRDGRRVSRRRSGTSECFVWFWDWTRSRSRSNSSRRTIRRRMRYSSEISRKWWTNSASRMNRNRLKKLHSSLLYWTSNMMSWNRVARCALGLAKSKWLCEQIIPSFLCPHASLGRKVPKK